MPLLGYCQQATTRFRHGESVFSNTVKFERLLLPHLRQIFPRERQEHSCLYTQRCIRYAIDKMHCRKGIFVCISLLRWLFFFASIVNSEVFWVCFHNQSALFGWAAVRDFDSVWGDKLRTNHLIRCLVHPNKKPLRHFRCTSPTLNARFDIDSTLLSLVILFIQLFMQSSHIQLYIYSFIHSFIS